MSNELIIFVILKTYPSFLKLFQYDQLPYCPESIF